MAGDADSNETSAQLPKDEAGRPGRAPANFQSDVTEVTASVAEHMTTPISASEAGELNARDVRARHTNLTEEATLQETDRRALPTEAGQFTVLNSKTTKRFSAA